MLPKPTPKPKPGNSAIDVIMLGIRNQQEMAAWYRRQAHPGPEQGIYVVLEMVHADSVNAWVMAVEGKVWVAPKG